MPLWLVKATWREDEAEASEKWKVNAETARDAVTTVTTHLRFQPHHVEVMLLEHEIAADLSPGTARRIP